VFAGLAAAQGSGGQTQLTCSTNVTAIPQLRLEGYTENTGDITITCTGGPTTAVGATIPAVNITIFLNTAVTSRLLLTSTDNRSEALLLIDEPGSTTLGTPLGAGQPFGPQAPQLLCPFPSGPTTAGNCTEFVSSVVSTAAGGATVNVATNTPQGITATSNGYNVFQGIVNANSVTWFGVPVLAPGSTGITRTFRFTNIRANATALGVNSPVVASIAVSNTAALPITQATPTVGFVQPGLTTSISGGVFAVQQCTSLTKQAVSLLTFNEGFGTAFKTRVAVTPALTNAVNATQGTGGPQNIPGTIYNSESNFVLPNTAPNGSLGGTSAGLADWGTRLKATFNSIPTGMRVFVSVNNVTNGLGGGPGPVTTANTPTTIGGNDITTPYAEAVSSETAPNNTGVGGVFPVATTSSSSGLNGVAANFPITELAVSATGTATAVWEVVNTNPSRQETLQFAVLTTFTSNVAQSSPPPGTATVNLSFAPTPPSFTAAAGAAASGSLGIPRFSADPKAPTSIFSVNICRTILLYPFVTNQAGFDTGLAIANTSTDPFGTGPQAGTCALNWFGGTTPPPPTNSGSIASGQVYTALASTTVPNFQGYMIAVCNFQYAHGFAFISDLGAQKLAMGYLALVIPDPSSNGGRAASGFDKAVGGSGEITAH